MIRIQNSELRIKNSKIAHLLHFGVLFLGLVLGGFLFFLFQAAPLRQYFVVVGTTIFYVLWGIFHHRMAGRFNLWILTEYLLVGTLVILIFTLILRL